MAGSTVRKLQVVSPVPADIDIANAVEPLHIAEIAKELNLSPSHYDLYDKYKAKVLLSVLDDLKGHEDGYYVVVGGITPTPLGEGKSTTNVGLCQALGAFLDKKYLRTTVRLTFEEGVEMLKEDLYAVVDWAYKIDPLRCINPDSPRKPTISEPQAPSPPGSCPSDCRRRDQ